MFLKFLLRDYLKIFSFNLIFSIFYTELWDPVTELVDHCKRNDPEFSLK